MGISGCSGVVAVVAGKILVVRQVLLAVFVGQILFGVLLSVFVGQILLAVLFAVVVRQILLAVLFSVGIGCGRKQPRAGIGRWYQDRRTSGRPRRRGREG